jgi:acyl carrier protein
MTEEQILAGIRQVFAERLRHPGAIRPEQHVQRDLHLDSLQLLALVVELENHFRVCFDAGDEEGVATIGDVARLVARRLSEGGGDDGGDGRG